MNLTSASTISVNKIDNSKINQVDFDNLVFGQVFTDHMFECDYIDGSWQAPTIRPYGPMSIEPAAKVFSLWSSRF